MPQRVIIVGGGVGGTIVANVLARTLHPHEAEITVIESTGRHAYMPGWLYLPFNHLAANSDHIIRRERDLLNQHVHLVTSLYYHMEKQLFNRAYWYIVPQGLV